MLRHGLDSDGALLALACSSHSGEEFQVDAAREILARAGLSESDLQNTPDYPYDEVARTAWIAAGLPKQSIVQNCSGKHASMLATCVANGWDIATYREPRHPLQVAISETVAELAGAMPSAVAVDGCGAPIHAIPLAGLARSFGRLAAAQEGPEARVAQAMQDFPEYVGGTRRDVTTLMRRVARSRCQGRRGGRLCRRAGRRTRDRREDRGRRLTCARGCRRGRAPQARFRGRGGARPPSSINPCWAMVSPSARSSRSRSDAAVRAVLQRVTRARVEVDGEVVGEISRPGLVALVGVTHDDGPEQVERMARKIAELRILRDEQSLVDAAAPVLVVSQFTLYADTRKGRRPSWSAAAPGPVAEPLVEAVVAALRARGVEVGHRPLRRDDGRLARRTTDRSHSSWTRDPLATRVRRRGPGGSPRKIPQLDPIVMTAWWLPPHRQLGFQHAAVLRLPERRPTRHRRSSPLAARSSRSSTPCATRSGPTSRPASARAPSGSCCSEWPSRSAS